MKRPPNKRKRNDVETVERANTVKDGLTLLSPTDGRLGLPEGCTERFVWAADLTDAQRDFTFALVEANVQRYYECCSAMGGWDEAAMRAELFDAAGRFLIIFHQEVPVAFASFRFDMDYGRPVVYCYQLHVMAKQQGKGLGRWLMGRLHALGRAVQMERCVLTVFEANAPAMHFYSTALGYKMDRTSPRPGVGYRILSVDLTTPPAPTSL
eukprot:GGOE01044258.1.p1 GENE.GGOE01044258.1~~GGOE01044258.1.p1  ORF type:complete len:210 (-),score=59.62 GGOE01044258.1:250-879(-)